MPRVGQRLFQLQQLAGIGAVEQLNRRHRQSTGATGCANMAARLAFREQNNSPLAAALPISERIMAVCSVSGITLLPVLSAIYLTCTSQFDDIVVAQEMFLIAWPLTRVPLVLFGSSRESCRMVTTACSPEDGKIVDLDHCAACARSGAPCSARFQQYQTIHGRIGCHVTVPALFRLIEKTCHQRLAAGCAALCASRRSQNDGHIASPYSLARSTRSLPAPVPG